MERIMASWTSPTPPPPPLHPRFRSTGNKVVKLLPLPSVASSTRISLRLASLLSPGPYTFPSHSKSLGKVSVTGAGSRRIHRLLVQSKGSSTDAGDRILAAAGYLLPLLDGLQYGRFFFLQFPAAEVVIKPIFPLFQLYRSVPFASFVAFFTLYLLVVRNPRLSRYVRFNTMQAVVLDVLLILPSLVERTFTPQGGIGFDLLVIFYNTVFLYLVACFVFGTVSCLLGKVPRLPLVADAADAQVM